MTPEEAYEEALRRIEEAVATEAIHLALYDLPLAQLPPEIGKCAQLHTLKLGDIWPSQARLIELPETLFKLTNLTSLNLSGAGLTNLPVSIGQLTNLTSLDLSFNNLTILPDSIGQLTNLIFLNFSYNGNLATLPDSIGQLTNLTSLGFTGTSLTTLPDSIGQLTNLTSLYLSRNKNLTTLPHSIGQLTNLTSLYLDSTNLTTLPHSIGQLTNLTSLGLNSTNLTTLPHSIGQLASLTFLNLSYNKNLTTLPDSIGQLTKLTFLNFSGITNLTTLPDSISQLINLTSLYLRDNPGLAIPSELVTQYCNPQAILAYWQAQQQGLSHPLHEARLILIGQGEVGKTSLVHRLLGQPFNPHEDATQGIHIDRWEVRITLPTSKRQEKSAVRLHVWDFGGQEIMHATHQFFLTQRALYLLVLDARQGERESRIEYWLALIQSFTGESPVLIIINKIDQYHLDINRRGLQQKYPNIVGFVRTSAATGAGLAELQDKIQQAVAQLPHLDKPFPQRWWQVKKQLETLQKQRDFLPYAEYRQLCQATGLKDDRQQRTLIGFLHDLGIALNFDDDRVRDTNILNPEWVTQGVYTLITSPQLAQKSGILARRQVGELLDPVRYPPEQQGFILRMMEKFELAYPLDDGTGYLVPDLLPAEEPVFVWDNHDALHFVYHYHVLPYNILHRLMVRQHDKICDTVAWRTGVMLAYEGMKALIKADIEDSKIHIAITGKGRRREFLGMLRFTFTSIHQHLAGTKPEEHVPIPGYPGITIPYTFLVQLENENEAFARWPGVAEKINVQALLGTIETLTMRLQATLLRQEILERLVDQLSQEEVRTLCFNLSVQYDDLPGEGRVAKLRELVMLMEKRGRIPDLLSAFNKLTQS